MTSLAPLPISEPVFLLEQTYLTDPDVGTTTTRYYADQTWLSRVDDDVAANREYVGILAGLPKISRSWFDGSRVGGQSTSDVGEAQLILLDEGEHGSQRDVVEGRWQIAGQPTKYRFGDRSWKLSQFTTLELEGTHVHQSADSTRLILDLSDRGRALATNILSDRFMGLDYAVRHLNGETSTQAASTDFDLGATDSFLFELFYRLSPGATFSSSSLLGFVLAAPGGRAFAIRAMTAGHLRGETADAAGNVEVVDCTDLEWIADGRFHHAALLGTYDAGDVTLELFHTTRTGAVKSSISATHTRGGAVASSGAVTYGDPDSFLAADHTIDVDELRFYKGATPPTEAEILERMRRPLTATEISSYTSYVKCNTNTGTTSSDETGNGNTLTIPSSSSWVQTFEGKDELAGSAKPVTLGRPYRTPGIEWIDKEANVAAVHSRTYKGLFRAEEGGKTLSIGWDATEFLGVEFVAASKRIHFTTRVVAGVDFLPAQPGLYGLQPGQVVIVTGTSSNDGTYTVDVGDLGIDGLEGFSVVEALVNESAASCRIEAKSATNGTPDVKLFHAAGAIKFRTPPLLPVLLEPLGDIGADIPTNDSAIHFPERCAGIMSRVLSGWGGVDTADIDLDLFLELAETATCDDYAGEWIDPGKGERSVRDVLDAGATSLWARWGWNQIVADWQIYRIDIPTGTADVELDEHEFFDIGAEKSEDPPPKVIVRGRRNFAPLKTDDKNGTASDAQFEASSKEWLAGEYENPETRRKYPKTEPFTVDTWFRRKTYLDREAKRRQQIFALEPKVWTVQAWWYGIEQSLLTEIFEATYDRFPELESGRKFYAVGMEAEGPSVTLNLWG